MNSNELKAADTKALLDDLDYCGYDSYYRDYREEIIAEIERRLNRYKTARQKNCFADGCQCTNCDTWIDRVDNYCWRCGAEILKDNHTCKTCRNYYKYSCMDEWCISCMDAGDKTGIYGRWEPKKDAED